MSILSELRNLLFRTHRTARRDKRRTLAYWADVERLESRQLLTIGLNFDFTAITSDLSQTHRFFGTDDAPAEIIRFGEGRVTSFQSYDADPSVIDPTKITFSFGSNNVANPVEALTLSTFDDGLADGTANQIYAPDGDDNPLITFYYDGKLMGRGEVTEIALETAANGTVTSAASTLKLDTARPSSVNSSSTEWKNFSFLLESAYQNGDQTTFPANDPTVTFSLATFQLVGTWAGVGDAEIFQSSGMATLVDDYTDENAFARPAVLSEAQSISGRIDRKFDYDQSLIELDSSRVYTFEIISDVTVQINFVRVESFQDEAHGIPGVQGTVYQSGDTFDIQGASRIRMAVLHAATAGNPDTGEYELRMLSSTPKVFWAEVDDSGNQPVVTWTPQLDESGIPLPVDSYEVLMSYEQFTGGVHHSAELHRETVAADVLQYTIDVPPALGSNFIRIGRVVNGEVVEWTNAAGFQRQYRPQLNSVQSNVVSWAPIVGARYYVMTIQNLTTGQLVPLPKPGGGADVTHLTVLDSESVTLPADFHIGEFNVWVRAASVGGKLWAWSSPTYFVSRTAVKLSPIQSSARPTVTWNDLGAARYQIYMTNVTTGQQGIVNVSNVTDTMFTPEADLSFGKYLVWGRGFDGNNGAGQWSAVQTFSVKPDIVGTTFNANPLRPTLEWTMPAGTASVNLYVLNGTTVIRENGLTDPTWTPDTDLVSARTTWWVQGVDAFGNTSRWTGPAYIGLDRPIVTSVEASTLRAPLVHWTPMQGAVSYTVWIQKFGGQRLVLEGGITETSYQAFDFGVGGVFSVWVKAVDSAGTEFWSFRRDFEMPAFRGTDPTITSPKGGIVSNTPTITWVEIEGHNTFTIWISKVGVGNVLLEDVEGVGVRSFTVTNPLDAGDYRFWVRVSSGGWSKQMAFTIS